MIRWLAAAAGLAAIVLIDQRWGHAAALTTLLAWLLLVAIFGGPDRAGTR